MSDPLGICRGGASARVGMYGGPDRVGAEAHLRLSDVEKKRRVRGASGGMLHVAILYMQSVKCHE